MRYGSRSICGTAAACIRLIPERTAMAKKHSPGATAEKADRHLQADWAEEVVRRSHLCQTPVAFPQVTDAAFNASRVSTRLFATL